MLYRYDKTASVRDSQSVFLRHIARKHFENLTHLTQQILFTISAVCARRGIKM